MEEEYNLDVVREREAAVRHLEQNILDVNGIFKELATLIHEQGEQVNSIEANVDNTVIRVTEGEEQLRQARHHHASAMRKKFCLITSGIIGLAVLIVIIYYAAK